MMIDFRSDTVTQPTQAMRLAMSQAQVGDDVYGDDPSVNELQAFAADLLGFDDALFVCSGTQANLLALMAHCGRGDEYICGQWAHNYQFEGGGAAVLGSIQPQPLMNQADGTLLLDDIRAAIKPDDVHFANTKLISLENTISGMVLPESYMAQVQTLAFDNRLKVHLDGARLANAAVASRCSMAQLCQYFDSVSLCLSKGLAAPVGSLLLGDTGFIRKARRWRKVLGGGMRQAGVLAAAAMLALTEQVERLSDDHQHARLLANELADIDGFEVEMSMLQTNMVFVQVASDIDIHALADALKQQGVIITPSSRLRLVTHKDISRQDIVTAIKHIKQVLYQSA